MQHTYLGGKESQLLTNHRNSNHTILEVGIRSSFVNSVPKYSDFIHSGFCKEDGNDWHLIQNTNARHRFKVSLKQIFCYLDEVHCVAFSKTGNYMATGSYNSVHIYDAKAFEKVMTLVEETDYIGGGPDVLALSFSCNGQRLATGNAASNISIWDLSEQMIIKKISGSGACLVLSLEFSPWGNLLASGAGGGGGATLWNIMDVGDPTEIKHTMAYVKATGRLGN